MLGDFGEAFKPAEEARFTSNIPLIYSPPEAHLDSSSAISFPHDIWSLACTFFEVVSYYEFPLFGAFWNTPDCLIRSHTRTLKEKMPTDWWSRWKSRSEYFNEDGKPLKGQRVDKIEDLFEEYVQEMRVISGTSPPFDENEKRSFLDLLYSVLRWKPEDRITAENVLQSEYMKKWALPALEEDKKDIAWW